MTVRVKRSDHVSSSVNTNYNTSYNNLFPGQPGKVGSRKIKKV